MTAGRCAYCGRPLVWGIVVPSGADNDPRVWHEACFWISLGQD